MKRQWIILTLIFQLIFCAVEVVSRDTSKRGILAEFTFDTNGYTIILPIEFKDEEYLFIFDTGASYTGFDTSLKPLLGDVKRTEPVNKIGGFINLEFFDAPEAFLGSLNLQDCGEVVCMDLEKLMLSSIEGRKVSGFIGMDFLSKYVIQIDFDTGKLLFLKPKDTSLFSLFRSDSDKKNWGEKLNLKYSPGKNPYIKGNIPDVGDLYFMIDTGANINFLESEIFEKKLSKKNDETTNNSSQANSAKVEDSRMRIKDFSVGPFKYQGLIFHKGQMSFLGIPFLSRHIVTFDFPNKKVYLKKGRAFARIDEEDMSGLHLLRISNEIVVHSIDEGSPAQKAGIKANDVILEVENKDANTYNIWKVRQLLKSGDKKTITMKVKSGNKAKTATFQLKKAI